MRRKNIILGHKLPITQNSNLSDRAATIGIGDTRFGPFKTPNRGTPQGSIFSPLMFNLTIIKIAKKLEERDKIGEVIYVGDITVWTQNRTLRSKLDQQQDTIKDLQEPIITDGHGNGLRKSANSSD